MWILAFALVQELEFGADVLDVAYAPDGRTLATAGKDRSIRLWDPQGQELRVIRGHTGEVFSIRFSPDGTRLVSASDDDTVRLWDLEDGSIHLWDAESGKEAGAFAGPAAKGYRFVWSPDGKRIASAREGVVRVGP